MTSPEPCRLRDRAHRRVFPSLTARLRRASVALALLAVSTASVRAITIDLTWVGTDSDATNPSNWTGAGLEFFPAATVDRLNFGPAATGAIGIPTGAVLVVRDIVFSGDRDIPYVFRGSVSPPLPALSVLGDITVASSGPNNSVTFENSLAVYLSGTATHRVEVAGSLTGLIVASDIGELNGPARIHKTGTGRLTLSGNNTFSGGFLIENGILSIGSDSALGAIPDASITGYLTFNGGTLETTDSFTLHENRGIQLGENGGTLDVAVETILSFGGKITHHGDSPDSFLIKDGEGTLLLSGTGLHPGRLVINAGAVKLSAENTFTSGTDIEVGSSPQSTATLRVDANQTIRGLTGTGTVEIGSTAMLKVNLPAFDDDGENFHSVFAGTITGFGTLKKEGPGTLTLTGENSYAGGTIIFGGDLRLEGGSIVHTSANTLVQRGALQLSSGATLIDANAYLGMQAGDTASAVLDEHSIWRTSNLYLGYGEVSYGVLLITGGGDLTVAETLHIGKSGLGALEVDGGTVQAGEVSIGTYTDSYGGLNITGDSSLSTARIVVGDEGVGALSVSSGASVKVDEGLVLVGHHHQGYLDISDGGSVSSKYGMLGEHTDGHGYALIRGPDSEWAVGDTLILGDEGWGQLTVAHGGTISVADGAGTIVLGDSSSGAGVLSIGSEPNYVVSVDSGPNSDNQTNNYNQSDTPISVFTPVSGGFINAAEITTGAGNGSLWIGTNATETSPYYLTKDGTESGGTFAITGNIRFVNAAGHTVVKGNHTYTGFTEIHGGTLEVGNDNALPTTTTLGMASGAQFRVSANQTIARFLATISEAAEIIIASGKTLEIATQDSTRGGAGSFGGTISGEGSLFLNGVAGTLLTLYGDNTFSGPTKIASDNTLQLGFDSMFGSVAGPIENDGTLIFARHDLAAPLVIESKISGSGRLVHQSSFTVLAGANDYTGGTEINGGVVVARTSEAFGQWGSSGGSTWGGISVNRDGTVAVLDNATISNPVYLSDGATIAGHGTFASAVTIGAGVTIQPEFDTEFSIGHLRFDDLTLDAGGLYEWNLLDPANYDRVSITSPSSLHIDFTSGTFTLQLISLSAAGTPGAASGFTFGQDYTFTVFDASGSQITGFDPTKFTIDASLFATNVTDFGVGSFSLVQNGLRLDLNFKAVPEPSTWALMITGLGLVIVATLRRKRAQP